MLDSAIAFSALAHAGQRRRYTNDPYVVHPIEVMTILNRYRPGNPNMLVAAILHDVLEDTLVSSREIERRFGADVLRMVVGLTEVRVEGNRAVRKAAERVRLAGQDGDVQTIKCCDVISNVSTILERDPGFAAVYLKEAKALLDVLTKAHPDTRADAFRALAS